MKPIQTIRVGAVAFAAACALGACMQPRPTTTMPDANTRYDTRPSPHNTLPAGAAGGEPADVPPPGPNGAEGDAPLPGTPPPMQY
ncbi:hypothetical protein SB768_10450 [Burkholderia sp. SIMBA_043]|uniref:Lipoprotein n=1 Tax=Burkholderia ubonensis TaxID=101571 RepID=A0A1B4LI70_9BURK|nr:MULTISPECIES: hypothetical protein [Burkholderia cepacia complex]AJY08657.1 hypothetical protein AK36_5220 [Burkholderia vietnamiensis LMG 10929]AOJ76887.1 hypothetical protein WJ35_17705 [Burkholderia ubonensis]AOK13984.1 hypothetical protein WK31_27165 [Burkholderia vietnamiensis]AVR14529.1 hypothetical protein A8H33_13715 [Burkholderia vietnamiensis]KVE61042.1 hypothetical protein WI96_25060 [Burkholderia vietnamiensis]